MIIRNIFELPVDIMRYIFNMLDVLDIGGLDSALSSRGARENFINALSRLSADFNVDNGRLVDNTLANWMSKRRFSIRKIIISRLLTPESLISLSENCEHISHIDLRQGYLITPEALMAMRCNLKRLAEVNIDYMNYRSRNHYKFKSEPFAQNNLELPIQITRRSILALNGLGEFQSVRLYPLDIKYIRVCEEDKLRFLINLFESEIEEDCVLIYASTSDRVISVCR